MNLIEQDFYMQFTVKKYIPLFFTTSNQIFLILGQGNFKYPTIDTSLNLLLWCPEFFFC